MTSAGDVLVVDDDPDMVEVMLALLRDSGYEARSAANGRQALAVVAERAPALVLLDMLMPVMDGWQCARALRSKYGRHIPIVVVTAGEHVSARGQEVDADDVLPKPFEVKDLLRIVERYVKAPQQHHGGFTTT
jgi:CheY-like chemotaxis protein